MSSEPTDGWARHRDAQRRAWLRLSYRERLSWLERAKAFVLKAQTARRASPPASLWAQPGGGSKSVCSSSSAADDELATVDE